MPDDKYWVQLAYHRKGFEEPPGPRPEPTEVRCAGAAQQGTGEQKPEEPKDDKTPEGADDKTPEGADDKTPEGGEKGKIEVAGSEAAPDGNGDDYGKRKRKIREVSQAQEESELAGMRSSDHPRVRQIFDIIDAPAKGKPLPDGVRIAQGDLVAPGLILEEEPFPPWLHEHMIGNGWTYDKGAASFMLLVGEAQIETVENEQPVVKRLSAKAHAVMWYEWVMQILQNDAEHAAKTGRTPLRDNVGVYIREDHTELLQSLLEQG